MAEAAGFWSYVREDDAGDDGRILQLADDLRAQYRMLTAEELQLFIDRESLLWGDEWAKRISDAIAGTTFFIPIITPSYFRSNACRQELLKFIRDAARLGLEELLMPVYWVAVSELEDAEESTDEAIRSIAKYNWVDLRAERLEDRASSIYRKAVAGLAQELAKRAAAVTATVEDVPEIPSAQAGDEDEDLERPGILEELAISEEALPELTKTLEGIGDDINLIGQYTEEANDELQAAAQRGSQGMKLVLTMTEKLAHRLDPPARRIEAGGHEYAATLATINPGIRARLDIIAGEEDLNEEHASFLRVVEQMAASADEALGQLEGMLEQSESLARFSRSLRAPLRRMKAGVQGVLDGRAIIEEWGQRATHELRRVEDTDGENEGTDGAQDEPVTGDESPPANPEAP